MRLFFLSLLLALGLLVSCDFQKKAASSEPEVVRDTVVVIVEPTSPKDSLVVAFERTPCFGRCPVFKIKVYESGFATYEGLNFAEKIGLYSYKFSQSDLDNIYQMAEDVGYFDFEPEYIDLLVSDLPSVISKISLKDKSHRVRAQMGTPESLNKFHQNLGILLNEKDWKPYSLR